MKDISQDLQLFKRKEDFNYGFTKRTKGTKTY